MTTLADLADRAQNAIGDSAAATWTQALIEEWVVEGLRDYSQHFPLTQTTTFTTTAGQREYTLPSDFVGVVSVEYPQGESPPSYLVQLSRLDPRFWVQDGWYDVLAFNDATTDSKLIVSNEPETGESIALVYHATHNFAVAAGGAVQVPAHHEHLLVDFVIWRVWLELLGAEQQAPTSNSSLLMAQLATNADRAKRQYVESLARAIYAAGGDSRAVRWRLDRFDRIY
jgi:hypothetical protein